ncbi:YfjI family protein, partial [Alphaproteobacteria bacterium]|nr:YfjI family protein [Alphaproteobacteria bacterium]
TSILNNDQVYDQGFLPRTLLVNLNRNKMFIDDYPDLKIYLANKNTVDAKNDIKIFNDKIFELLQSGYKGTGVANVASTLELSEKATKQLIAYRKRYVGESKREFSEFELIKPSLARSAEIASRLAAIISVMDDNLKYNQINENYTARAINLTDYYLREMNNQRTFSSHELEDEKAYKLMEWWRQKVPDNTDLEELSRRTLKQNAPHSLRKEINDILKICLDRGFIAGSGENKFTLIPRGDYEFSE